MEELCEFCAAVRPVIYCKSDAAHLCLSCDAKVHSANALSNRHLRTLLCDFCKTRPTHVHCLDHQVFLCHGCDQLLHEVSSRHRKRAIRSYMGCPSAKDFSRFWGFDSTEFESQGRDLFLSTSCVSANSIAPYSAARFHRSSLSHQKKISYKSQHKSTSVILQQILDLDRLQLISENNQTPLIRGEEKHGVDSSETIEEVLNRDSPDSQHLGTNILQRDNPLKELNADLLCFPFSQPEFLPSSSAVVNGESLWQFKSPVESSQLWSQNMQDLGVCDEFVCHDDFDIPDVDLTFRSFEELFGGDQGQARRQLDDEDLSFSSAERDMSAGRSNNLSSRIQDASMASYSLFDCGGSWYRSGVTSSYSFPSVEDGEMKKLSEDSSMRRRYKDKKSRLFEKQIECSSSKRGGDDFHKRVKGRSEKADGYVSAKLDATTSF